VSEPGLLIEEADTGRHVRRNDAAGRYELVDTDGQVLGVADYRLDYDVVVIPHTEIDPGHRGRGLGAELVRGTLDDLRAAGARVRPRCWYVASFIEEHPQYRNLLEA
jgi:predicted GNAT family acetyltransferase